MKKGLFTTVLLFMITLCFSSCQKTETFKVLQFNIWQEGTVVENGLMPLQMKLFVAMPISLH